MLNKKQLNWTTEGFERFREGVFGNGGQNIYVSKQGVLQRIHQTDVTGNGHVDLVFCNSQNHEEKVPLDVYPLPLNNSERNRQLFIGGSKSGCVTDLTGNGFEDLIVSCGWDGMTLVTNSAVFYGSDEGLNNKYVNFLPTGSAICVTAGDFNGNGKKDIVFISKSDMKIFYQGNDGFEPEKVVVYEFKNAVHLTTIKSVSGSDFDTLLIRKKDGSYSIIPGTSQGLDITREKQLLEADIDYALENTGQEGYTQTVDEPDPLAQIIELNGQLYLCAFRQKRTFLYPYKNEKLGEPIEFKCENAFSVAVGDINANNGIDLIFACRDKSTEFECSWIYLSNKEGSWNEHDRIAIKTYHACDVLVDDFTGNGKLDIVICQSHTHESYTSEILIFSIEENTDLRNLKALRLPSHDAYRIFKVNNELIINNCRSGSLLGDGDAYVYIGDADGFKADRKINLPAWGCTDMVCCDLNDDGLPDLVLANAAELSPWLDPGSFIYYNTANGFAETPNIKLSTKRAHGVVCGDLNHNGYLDLVFCGFDNNKLKVFYGSEKGYTNENSVEIVMEENGKIYKEPRFLALADLNGNGWLDLVVTMINRYESFVLWGGPEGFSFDKKKVFHVRNSCNVKVADLNGNGYPDLIFGGHTQSLSGPHDAFVYIYWGGPEGFSEERRTLLPSDAVNSLAVADFNNDGRLDLFVGSYQNGRLRDIDSHIYWNQGCDGFLPHKRLPLRTHAVSGNLAADFTGNGWIDLAIGNHKVEGNHISYSTVWYNGPDGFDEKKTIDLPSEGIHGMGNVDLGNILDRSDEEFYVSKAHELPKGAKIVNIDWNAELPLKTWIKAQLRTAPTFEGLEDANWQEIDALEQNGLWMQYKLILGAKNCCASPRIKKVTVNYIESSIEPQLKPAKVITNPGKKYQTCNREFQGIPGIEITPKGRMWASWYAGGENEGPENFVLLVTSSDSGKNWSEPVMVIDPPGNVRAFDPNVWIDSLGKLWFFWSQSYSKKNGHIFDGQSGVWGIYTENPETTSPVWSEPVRFAEGIMLNKPTVLSNGEWIFPTALWKDGLGEGKLSEGLGPLSGANLSVSDDQGKTFQYRGGADIPNRWFDEHMFIEKQNGLIWSLIRTSYGIGESYSSDGGKTWSSGKDTGWGGPNSRFFIRRLQSGRLLLVNHALNPKTKKYSRNNLTAYLSDDDGESWHGALMLDERDNVSYPDGVQDENGDIWIIYDHERHRHGDILFARFREEDIVAGKCISTTASLKNLINSTGGIRNEVNRNQTNVM